MSLCEVVTPALNPFVLAPRNKKQQEADGYLLYLLMCSVRWHEEKDPSAGWDLIEGLRSPDPAAHSLCADALSRTKSGRLLNGAPRRSSPKVDEIESVPESKQAAQPERGHEMNTPYGLEISESCATCKLHKSGWFCRLSLEGMKSMTAISHLTAYPGGALLFVEGQTPRGAFILCSGKVKLTATSRDGKVLILKMAEGGSVLGLSAVIAGEPYELTAETVMPSQVNFIDRESLLRLMRANGELGLHATEALSREFQAAYRDIHDLVLARSSAGKLARLILSWVTERERNDDRELRVCSGATHEEMAQMIGSSRETVTRLLSDLKKRELIRLEGSTLVIRNRGALEEMAA